MEKTMVIQTQTPPIWSKYGFKSQAEYDYFARQEAKLVPITQRYYTADAGGKAGQLWSPDDAKGMPGCYGPYTNTELRIIGYKEDSSPFGFKVSQAQRARKEIYEAGLYTPPEIPKICSISNPFAREGGDLVYTITRCDSREAHTFTGSFLPNSTASHLDGEITGRQGAFAIAFAAGQKTAEVRVKTFTDSLVEPTERLTLAVSNGRDTSYGYGSIADVPPSQIRFNPIGGGDLKFSKGESTLISGKAASYASLSLHGSSQGGGDYLGTVKADSHGNWSYEASGLASRFGRETPIHLSVSDVQRQDRQLSSAFVFEKDPVIGVSAASNSFAAAPASPVASNTNSVATLSTFGIGGHDSVIGAGESTLVTGKSSPNARVNISINKRGWKTGDGPVSIGTYATADQAGNWSFELGAYKDTWARGGELGFTVRDNQGKNLVGTQIFSYAPDPVTGIGPAITSGTTTAPDLITGRNAVNGVTGATKWHELLTGTAGNDYFNGRGGQDQFYGKGGADVFDLRDYRGGSRGQSMGTNYATIRDFSADDHIIIGSSVTKIDQMNNGWARIWEGNQLAGVVMGDAASTLSLSSSHVHVV